MIDGKIHFRKLGKHGRIVYSDFKAELDRLSHIAERNALYAQIRIYPSSCRGLCYYQSYLVEPDNLLIDFKKWKQHTNNPLIECLSALPPPGQQMKWYKIEIRKTT